MESWVSTVHIIVTIITGVVISWTIRIVVRRLSSYDSICI